MVFLRLTVKILPREQIQPALSLFRSLLPERKDDSDRNGNGGANGKPASFLLVLEHPDEVTLGGLAGMIQAKWKKLRPDAEPLEIKKLVDDAHDSEDLDPDMTVADVFVDNGKARSDGLDQRGTVRVIQKPAPYAPTRFSSVVQDWDAAAQHYERMKEEEAKSKPKVPKFETIEEETTPVSSRFSQGPYSSNGSRRQSDVPVRSVERDEPLLTPPRWGRESPALAPPSQEQEQADEVAATPQARRMESKELGESPTPVRQLAPELAPDPFARPEIPEVETRFQLPGLRPESAHEIETASPFEQQKPETNLKAATTYATAQDDVDMTDVEPESPREKQRVASPVVVIDNHVLQTIVEKKPQGAATRKRKKSSEQLPPQKGPRLQLTSSPSETRSKSKEPRMTQDCIELTDASSPVRRREKAPSFSGPQRRPSLTDHSVKPGLGLGITKSPPRKQSVAETNDRLPNRDPVSTTPLFPSSAARRLSFGQQADVTPSKAQSPGVEHIKRSAMRKDSPLERSQERRSVSFAEEADIVTTPAAPAPRSVPRSTPRTGSKADQSTPRSTPLSSSQTMVFPANVPRERLEQYINEAAEKTKKEEAIRAEKSAEYERKIKAAEESGNHEHVRLLRDVFFTWKEVVELEKSNKRDERSRLNRLRAKLRNKEKLLLEKEEPMTLSAKRSKPKADPGDRLSSRASSKSKSATKSKSPVAKETSAAALPEQPKVTQATNANGLPHSSLDSDDINLPTVPKIRSTEETKLTSKAPKQTSTVAKRQITKADISPEGTSESEDDEDEPENKSASEEKDSYHEADSESAVAGPAVASEDNTSAAKEQHGDEDDEDEGPEMAKAEMLERVRSPARSRSGSVPAWTGSPLKSPSHAIERRAGEVHENPTAEPIEKAEEPSKASPPKAASEKESSASESTSSSESESESEDESDDDTIPPGRNSAPPPSTAPARLNGTGILPNGHSPALPPSAQSSLGSFTSSQPDSARKRIRASLKGMLAEQKSLQAERAKNSKQRVFSNQNNRPARKDIFSPSGSSESESDSDSGDDTGSSDEDRGDILPTGSATKIRKVIKRAK
ncbi:hypothetical protein DTO027B5_4545 [Paecilomyces variotii]|nr:hypothetical protein DTO027B3_5476 [Paecilomyces variotii]KAJ9333765.1 hypothetical protein DTO027B5_4545 [Paecilomyces variotii]